MPDRVLITGGTGFIGSYVARALLDRGDEVVLFDLQPLSAEARFVLGDAAGEIPVEIGGVDNWPRLFEVGQTTATRRDRPHRGHHQPGLPGDQSRCRRRR